jgi:hypothetical protein
MKISNVDSVIIQFLDHHRINYLYDTTRILVDDPKTLFNKIVVDNELDLVHKIGQSIDEFMESPQNSIFFGNNF